MPVGNAGSALGFSFQPFCTASANELPSSSLRRILATPRPVDSFLEIARTVSLLYLPTFITG